MVDVSARRGERRNERRILLQSMWRLHEDWLPAFFSALEDELGRIKRLASGLCEAVHGNTECPVPSARFLRVDVSSSYLFSHLCARACGEIERARPAKASAVR